MISHIFSTRQQRFNAPCHVTFRVIAWNYKAKIYFSVLHHNFSFFHSLSLKNSNKIRFHFTIQVKWFRSYILHFSIFHSLANVIKLPSAVSRNYQNTHYYNILFTPKEAVHWQRKASLFSVPSFPPKAIWHLLMGTFLINRHPVSSFTKYRLMTNLYRPVQNRAFLQCHWSLPYLPVVTWKLLTTADDSLNAAYIRKAVHTIKTILCLHLRWVLIFPIQLHHNPHSDRVTCMVSDHNGICSIVSVVYVYSPAIWHTYWT